MDQDSAFKDTETPFRILRATDAGKEDGKIETRDFRVPACLLRVSEVWEPLSVSDGGFVSEDNVIPLRDPIPAIESLVSWMSRHKGFEINEYNWIVLAQLADKYMIESLHRDVRMYTIKLSFIKTPKKTVTGWVTAATYGFAELEQYHRSSDAIQSILRNAIGDDAKGLGYFLGLGVQLQALNSVIKEALGFRNAWPAPVQYMFPAPSLGRPESSELPRCAAGCGRLAIPGKWNLCDACTSEYT